MQMTETFKDDWEKRIDVLYSVRRIFEEQPSLRPPKSMGQPLSDLIHDLRSNVVREVCSFISFLAQTYQEGLNPLSKLLLPALVQACGSGNKVCAEYCNATAQDLVSQTFSKASVSFLSQTIQEHRNKDIRRNCLLYMTIILTKRLAQIQNQAEIEQMILSAVQDASSDCRSHGTKCFLLYHTTFPQRSEQYILRLLDQKTQQRLVTSPNALPSPEKPSAIASESDFKVGQRICLVVRQLNGTIRYIGQTHFATGEWIGLELDQPRGKNDGSVANVSYFACQRNHGLFVRANQIASSLISTTDTTSSELKHVLAIHSQYVSSLLMSIRQEMDQHHAIRSNSSFASSADLIAFVDSIKNASQQRMEMTREFLNQL